MRKALFFLGILDDSDIEWMMTAGVKLDVAPSQILISEGQRVDALFLVLDGKLSVTVGGTANRELARLQCGEVVGEMSFVDSRPPSATVQALEKSVVLKISRSRLDAKLAEDPPFAARFYRALAVFLSDRLRGTVARLGYGKGIGPDDDNLAIDEIDDAILDNLSLAGARFDWLQRRLRAI
jgi:CRP/FNR family cyclic AMP-dependent transcriptional regulator